MGVLTGSESGKRDSRQRKLRSHKCGDRKAVFVEEQVVLFEGPDDKAGRVFYR